MEGTGSGKKKSSSSEESPVISSNTSTADNSSVTTSPGTSSTLAKDEKVEEPTVKSSTLKANSQKSGEAEKSDSSQADAVLQASLAFFGDIKPEAPPSVKRLRFEHLARKENNPVGRPSVTPEPSPRSPSSATASGSKPKSINVDSYNASSTTSSGSSAMLSPSHASPRANGAAKRSQEAAPEQASSGLGRAKTSPAPSAVVTGPLGASSSTGGRDESTSQGEGAEGREVLSPTPSPQESQQSADTVSRPAPVRRTNSNEEIEFSAEESGNQRVLYPPSFANLDICVNCNIELGYVYGLRRHHCRNCGNTFCDSCSSRRVVVPFKVYLNRGEQRVCDACFSKITEFQKQVGTTDYTWDGPPPLTAEEFAKEFEIPEEEAPMGVFACSYFPTHTPVYGKMYLSQSYLCFKGYEESNHCIDYAKITSIAQPMLYFVNAIEVFVGDEKFFYAGFEGQRDKCYARLEQLVTARKHREKQKEAAEEATDHELVKRKMSSRLLSTLTPLLDSVDEQEVNKKIQEAEAEIDLDIRPPPDTVIAQMSSMLDEELPVSVRKFFHQFWANDTAFYTSYLVAQKDIEIKVGPWQKITNEHARKVGGFTHSTEEFEFFREVYCQHPPKVKFPGLSAYAAVHRTQKYRLESGWSRLVVSELAQFSKIPYSDYFNVESRWVVTRDSKESCHVEVGLSLNFRKSTWFQSQITSSTHSESKEAYELWYRLASKQAREQIKAQLTPRPGPVTTPKGTEKEKAAGEEKLREEDFFVSDEEGEEEEEEGEAEGQQAQTGEKAKEAETVMEAPIPLEGEITKEAGGEAAPRPPSTKAKHSPHPPPSSATVLQAASPPGSTRRGSPLRQRRVVGPSERAAEEGGIEKERTPMLASPRKAREELQSKRKVHQDAYTSPIRTETALPSLSVSLTQTQTLLMVALWLLLLLWTFWVTSQSRHEIALLRQELALMSSRMEETYSLKLSDVETVLRAVLSNPAAKLSAGETT